MIEQVQEIYEQALVLTTQHLKQLQTKSLAVEPGTGALMGLTATDATVIQNYIKAWSSVVKSAQDEDTNEASQLSDENLIKQAQDIMKAKENANQSDEG